MAIDMLSDTAPLARCFQALSDPTRLEILERLAGGEHCVCDLTDALGAAQSRLSFHLKVLKTAGLVRDRKEGRWSYYSVNPEVLEAMEGYLRTARESAASGADPIACCG